jgi:N4-bis(aminopropyl)spermidine synthase
MNAISDVIHQRPRPLREFDQIYMKAGDMVLQSELIAKWADEARLVFVGDGDAIGVSIAYLKAREILPYGPSHITVLDFDERIVNSVERFADSERLDTLGARLYNCLDALPEMKEYDLFYTNPPWGASNDGESVKLFCQRGIEAVKYNGEGVVVIADDDDLTWPKQVLVSVQSFAISQGFFVSKMMPRLHSYHLDDNPELRSCNLFFRSVDDTQKTVPSLSVSDPSTLEHFYGESLAPRVHYVRERLRLGYGKAHADEYELELLEEL